MQCTLCCLQSLLASQVPPVLVADVALCDAGCWLPVDGLSGRLHLGPCSKGAVSSAPLPSGAWSGRKPDIPSRDWYALCSISLYEHYEYLFYCLKVESF